MKNEMKEGLKKLEIVVDWYFLVTDCESQCTNREAAELLDKLGVI